MSVETKLKDVTVNTFFKKKENNEKITMLTAYDCSTAKYFDNAPRVSQSVNQWLYPKIWALIIQEKMPLIYV